MCTSFKEASAGLCKVLTSVARHLCTTRLVDPTVLMPFVACRLIPLDKNPGVRPIGIGDVPRRIVSKATLFVIGEDIASFCCWSSSDVCCWVGGCSPCNEGAI